MLSLVESDTYYVKTCAIVGKASCLKKCNSAEKMQATSGNAHALKLVKHASMCDCYFIRLNLVNSSQTVYIHMVLSPCRHVGAHPTWQCLLSLPGVPVPLWQGGGAWRAAACQRNCSLQHQECLQAFVPMGTAVPITGGDCKH